VLRRVAAITPHYATHPAIHATQVQRLMARDSMGAAAALSRIQAQMPLEAKVPLADAIIDNRGSEERTREQVGGWGDTITFMCQQGSPLRTQHPAALLP